MDQAIWTQMNEEDVIMGLLRTFARFSMVKPLSVAEYERTILYELWMGRKR